MAQVKIVTTPNSDKDKKKLDHSYIAGMDKNGTAALESSLAVS